jgi:hypothetical protein
VEFHRAARLVQRRAQRLLDQVGLALFDQKNRLLALAEAKELVLDDRIGDVHHVKRHLGLAMDICEAQPLQRADHAIVHAALKRDADLALVRPENLVEPVLADVIERGRQAFVHLLLFMDVGGRRQHHPVGAALRVRQRVAHAERRALIVLRLEGTVDMAGPDPHLQHHGGVRGLGKLEAVAHRLRDRGQVRPRIEKPDLAFLGVGMRALLHDRGALAIVLADDDERTARHAARGEVRERVRGDIGAHRALEGDRAADRVVHARRQHRGRRRLAGVGLEPDAELTQQFLGVGQHVHQVADRRALVAADVADPTFQQRLRDREDTLAPEGLAGADAQLLDFLLEGSLSHGRVSLFARRIYPVAYKLESASSALPDFWTSCSISGHAVAWKPGADLQRPGSNACETA